MDAAIEQAVLQDQVGGHSGAELQGNAVAVRLLPEPLEEPRELAPRRARDAWDRSAAGVGIMASRPRPPWPTQQIFEVAEAPRLTVAVK